MASVLPLLLIGGAALVIVGSKKKGGTKTGLPAPGELALPPTTPPPLTKTVKKSGSGYPGVTRARMQEIQTMLLSNGYDLGKWRADGRYGSATKAAVMAFQMDHMPEPEWDGKPGPKTQAVLQRVEAERVSGQQEEAQKFPEEAAQIVDECDPLDAGTWGSGNVCEWTGSRWVRATAKMSPTPKKQAPPANLWVVDSLAKWTAMGIAASGWSEDQFLIGIVYRSNKTGYVNALIPVARQNPSIIFTVAGQDIIDMTPGDGLVGTCGPADVSMIGAGRVGDEVEDAFVVCWGSHPSSNAITKVALEAVEFGGF